MDDLLQFSGAKSGVRGRAKIPGAKPGAPTAPRPNVAPTDYPEFKRKSFNVLKKLDNVSTDTIDIYLNSHYNVDYIMNYFNYQIQQIILENPNIINTQEFADLMDKIITTIDNIKTSRLASTNTYATNITSGFYYFIDSKERAVDPKTGLDVHLDFTYNKLSPNLFGKRAIYESYLERVNGARVEPFVCDQYTIYDDSEAKKYEPAIFLYFTPFPDGTSIPKGGEAEVRMTEIMDAIKNLNGLATSLSNINMTDILKQNIDNAITTATIKIASLPESSNYDVNMMNIHALQNDMIEYTLPQLISLISSIGVLSTSQKDNSIYFKNLQFELPDVTVSKKKNVKDLVTISAVAPPKEYDVNDTGLPDISLSSSVSSTLSNPTVPGAQFFAPTQASVNVTQILTNSINMINEKSKSTFTMTDEIKNIVASSLYVNDFGDDEVKFLSPDQLTALSAQQTVKSNAFYQRLRDGKSKFYDNMKNTKQFGGDKYKYKVKILDGGADLDKVKFVLEEDAKNFKRFNDRDKTFRLDYENVINRNKLIYDMINAYQLNTYKDTLFASSSSYENVRKELANLRTTLAEYLDILRNKIITSSAPATMTDAIAKINNFTTLVDGTARTLFTQDSKEPGLNLLTYPNYYQYSKTIDTKNPQAIFASLVKNGTTMTLHSDGNLDNFSNKLAKYLNQLSDTEENFNRLETSAKNFKSDAGTLKNKIGEEMLKNMVLYQTLTNNMTGSINDCQVIFNGINDINEQKRDLIFHVNDLKDTADELSLINIGLEHDDTINDMQVELIANTTEVINNDTKNMKAMKDISDYKTKMFEYGHYEYIYHIYDIIDEPTGNLDTYLLILMNEHIVDVPRSIQVLSPYMIVSYARFKSYVRLYNDDDEVVPFLVNYLLKIFVNPDSIKSINSLKTMGDMKRLIAVNGAKTSYTNALQNFSQKTTADGTSYANKTAEIITVLNTDDNKRNIKYQLQLYLLRKYYDYNISLDNFNQISTVSFLINTKTIVANIDLTDISAINDPNYNFSDKMIYFKDQAIKPTSFNIYQIAFLVKTSEIPRNYITNSSNIEIKLFDHLDVFSTDGTMHTYNNGENIDFDMFFFNISIQNDELIWRKDGQLPFDKFYEFAKLYYTNEQSALLLIPMLQDMIQKTDFDNDTLLSYFDNLVRITQILDDNPIMINMGLIGIDQLLEGISDIVNGVDSAGDEADIAGYKEFVVKYSSYLFSLNIYFHDSLYAGLVQIVEQLQISNYYLQDEMNKIQPQPKLMTDEPIIPVGNVTIPAGIQNYLRRAYFLKYNGVGGEIETPDLVPFKRFALYDIITNTDITTDNITELDDLMTLTQTFWSEYLQTIDFSYIILNTFTQIIPSQKTALGGILSKKPINKIQLTTTIKTIFANVIKHSNVYNSYIDSFINTYFALTSAPTSKLIDGQYFKINGNKIDLPDDLYHYDQYVTTLYGVSHPETFISLFISIIYVTNFIAHATSLNANATRIKTLTDKLLNDNDIHDDFMRRCGIDLLEQDAIKVTSATNFDIENPFNKFQYLTNELNKILDNLNSDNRSSPSIFEITTFGSDDVKSFSFENDVAGANANSKKLYDDVQKYNEVIGIYVELNQRYFYNQTETSHIVEKLNSRLKILRDFYNESTAIIFTKVFITTPFIQSDTVSKYLGNMMIMQQESQNMIKHNLYTMINLKNNWDFLEFQEKAFLVSSVYATKHPIREISIYVYISFGVIDYYIDILRKLLTCLNRHVDSMNVFEQYLYKTHYISLNRIYEMFKWIQDKYKPYYNETEKNNPERFLYKISVADCNHNVSIIFSEFNSIRPMIDDYTSIYANKVSVHLYINDYGPSVNGVVQDALTEGYDRDDKVFVNGTGNDSNSLKIKFDKISSDLNVIKRIKNENPGVARGSIPFSNVYHRQDFPEPSIVSNYMSLPGNLKNKKGVIMMTYGYSGTGKTRNLFGGDGQNGILQSTLEDLNGSNIYLRVFEIYGLGSQYDFYWNQAVDPASTLLKQIPSINLMVFHYDLNGLNVQERVAINNLSHIYPYILTSQNPTSSVQIKDDGTSQQVYTIINNSDITNFSELTKKIDEYRENGVHFNFPGTAHDHIKQIKPTINNPQSSRSILVYDFQIESNGSYTPFIIYDLPGKEDLFKSYVDRPINVPTDKRRDGIIPDLTLRRGDTDETIKLKKSTYVTNPIFAGAYDDNWKHVRDVMALFDVVITTDPTYAHLLNNILSSNLYGIQNANADGLPLNGIPVGNGLSSYIAGFSNIELASINKLYTTQPRSFSDLFKNYDTVINIEKNVGIFGLSAARGSNKDNAIPTISSYVTVAIVKELSKMGMYRIVIEIIKRITLWDINKIYLFFEGYFINENVVGLLQYLSNTINNNDDEIFSSQNASGQTENDFMKIFMSALYPYNVSVHKVLTDKPQPAINKSTADYLKINTTYLSADNQRELQALGMQSDQTFYKVGVESSKIVKLLARGSEMNNRGSYNSNKIFRDNKRSYSPPIRIPNPKTGTLMEFKNQPLIQDFIEPYSDKVEFYYVFYVVTNNDKDAKAEEQIKLLNNTMVFIDSLKLGNKADTSKCGIRPNTKFTHTTSSSVPTVSVPTVPVPITLVTTPAKPVIPATLAKPVTSITPHQITWESHSGGGNYIINGWSFLNTGPKDQFGIGPNVDNMTPVIRGQYDSNLNYIYQELQNESPVTTLSFDQTQTDCYLLHNESNQYTKIEQIVKQTTVFSNKVILYYSIGIIINDFIENLINNESSNTYIIPLIESYKSVINQQNNIVKLIDSAVMLLGLKSDDPDRHQDTSFHGDPIYFQKYIPTILKNLSKNDYGEPDYQSFTEYLEYVEYFHGWNGSIITREDRKIINVTANTYDYNGPVDLSNMIYDLMGTVPQNDIMKVPNKEIPFLSINRETKQYDKVIAKVHCVSRKTVIPPKMLTINFRNSIGKTDMRDLWNSIFLAFQHNNGEYKYYATLIMMQKKDQIAVLYMDSYNFNSDNTCVCQCKIYSYNDNHVPITLQLNSSHKIVNNQLTEWFPFLIVYKMTNRLTNTLISNDRMKISVPVFEENGIPILNQTYIQGYFYKNIGLSLIGNNNLDFIPNTNREKQYGNSRQYMMYEKLILSTTSLPNDVMKVTVGQLTNKMSKPNKLMGFKNEGQSCFANSFLQAILQLPKYVETQKKYGGPLSRILKYIDTNVNTTNKCVNIASYYQELNELLPIGEERFRTGNDNDPKKLWEMTTYLIKSGHKVQIPEINTLFYAGVNAKYSLSEGYVSHFNYLKYDHDIELGIPFDFSLIYSSDSPYIRRSFGEIALQIASMITDELKLKLMPLKESTTVSYHHNEQFYPLLRSYKIIDFPTYLKIDISIPSYPQNEKMQTASHVFVELRKIPYVYDMTIESVIISYVFVSAVIYEGSMDELTNENSRRGGHYYAISLDSVVDEKVTIVEYNDERVFPDNTTNKQYITTRGIPIMLFYEKK